MTLSLIKWVSQVLISATSEHYNDYNDYDGYNDYNNYNKYNDYRDSDLELDLDWERFSELVT